MGRVYGVQGRAWNKPDGGFVDQYQKIITNLSQGIDDRGEILSFYNVGEFRMGYLRPCMFLYQRHARLYIFANMSRAWRYTSLVCLVILYI